MPGMLPTVLTCYPMLYLVFPLATSEIELPREAGSLGS